MPREGGGGDYRFSSCHVTEARWSGVEWSGVGKMRAHQMCNYLKRLVNKRCRSARALQRVSAAAGCDVKNTTPDDGISGKDERVLCQNISSNEPFRILTKFLMHRPHPISAVLYCSHV